MVTCPRFQQSGRSAAEYKGRRMSGIFITESSDRFVFIFIMSLSSMLLILIGCLNQAVPHPAHRVLSLPLQNPETAEIVQNLSQQAQRVEFAQDQDDSSIRLMPRVNSSQVQDRMKICCLHGNILQFYLNHILPHHKNQTHEMQRLRVDLSRVRDDLQTHGCNVTHGHTHPYTMEFSKKLDSMGERRLNKALSEVDILFSLLQGYCFQQGSQ